MGNQVAVDVKQVGPSASEGTARNHKTIMDRPEAKGGENRGAMGGEHLLMALGGCFMSNLLAAIQSREAKVSNVNLNIAPTTSSWENWSPSPRGVASWPTPLKTP